jgi:hypothetical protein
MVCLFAKSVNIGAPQHKPLTETALSMSQINVVASQSINQQTAMDACRTIIQQNGFSSLFDGLSAMMLRRSLDWGIRWGVASEVKNYMIHQKRARNESDDLAMHEMIMCGVSGGTISAFTHPIDNILTNSQKPLPPATKRDLISAAIRMYSESGIKAFTRGLAIKVVDSAYHMAWVYGVGAIAYSYMHRAIEGSRMIKERVQLQDEQEMTN